MAHRSRLEDEVSERSRSSGEEEERQPFIQQQRSRDQDSELQFVMREDSALEAQRESKPVSWASIPNKGQLAIMVFARLAEPLSERSLTSYLFYQLSWFNPSLEASEIAKQAGYLTAVFAAAQCVTSMWWGRASDSSYFGRKRVLVIGLLGTAMSALGMGFATSLPFAFSFRILAGALNGNIGVLRTMVSEVIVDKRYQSRAFLLLPMCFNVGIIIGPLLSGFLAEPVTALPNVFGPGSVFGGADGVQWMIKFPYALPNLVCATALITAALGVVLGLDETHPLLKHQPDRGRQLGKFLVRKALRKQASDASYRLIDEENSAHPTNVFLGDAIEDEEAGPQKATDQDRPAFKDMFTRNVCLTLLQHFLQSLHVSAFNAVLFVLLPTPRSKNLKEALPFRFTGGLGLSIKKIALANTTIGAIGIPLQVFLYPRINARMGVLTSYRTFLPLSIMAYFALPYLVLLPTKVLLIWICLTIVLSLQVLSRVFVNPATMILVNESSPSPALLGTVHGFASSVSSGARILGPTIGGALLSWGLANNFVGSPLWGMTIIAVVNWVLLWWVEDATQSA